MIELGGFQARDVVTSYKMFRVNARVSGKILPVVTVTEACEVIWCNDSVPTVQVREALDSLVRGLEWGCVGRRLGHGQAVFRRGANRLRNTTNDVAGLLEPTYVNNTLKYIW